MNKFTSLTAKLMHWLGNLASLLLILLVLIMAFNVGSRYLFNASSIGLEELSWHIYAAIFLLGIPYAMNSGAHVRVDLFYERFSTKKQALVDLVGTLVFLIPTCLVVCWAGWNFTLAAYQLGEQPTGVSEFFNQLVTTGIGEKSQDPGGLLNRWIIKGVIPFSFFCLLVAAVSMLIEKIAIVLQQGRGQA